MQSRLCMGVTPCLGRAVPPAGHLHQKQTSSLHTLPSRHLQQQDDRPDVSVCMGRRSDKIALRKGKENAKRAKVYGRIGKRIVSTVKAGGADPIGNVKLAELLRLAKVLNVPKEILDRNIKRASDAKQADFTEVCYEAYGPAGTTFIVECLTDNLNRSASEVKAVFTKSGCKVADPGSVMFSFTRSGQVYIENSSEDAVFEAAMEAGAEDVAQAAPGEEGEPSTSLRVYTSVEAFVGAKAALAKGGFTVNEEESSLVYKPNTVVEVDDEVYERCETILDKLLALDDVDAVYSNCTGLEL